MRHRCRLCDQRAVEGSIFCAPHREQAQRFSLSFGKQEESPDSGEAPPPDSSEDASEELKPAETKAKAKTKTKKTKTKPQAEPEAIPAEKAKREEEAAPPAETIAPAPEPGPRAEEPPTDREEERTVLATAFHAAFDALRTRLKEQADPDRWPQLSLYFLDDTLHCRPYFSIVPRKGNEMVAPRYALDDDRVHAALANGGAVLEELHEQFMAYAEELRDHVVQTLDVHFLTYAGLIAINGHLPGRKMRNFATLRLESGEFVKVELDDEVRAVMRHDHW